MSATLAAILPVMALIGLGFALCRGGFLPAAAWQPIERLVYYVLFPALLFLELATMRPGGLPIARMALTLVGTQLLAAGLAVLARRRLDVAGPPFTSLVQGLVRWNTYTGLALAGPLFGPDALPLIAVAVAVLVPMANLLSVAALARHGGHGGGPSPGLLRALAGNPLLLACLAGLCWSVLHLPVPALARAPLHLLGQATLPLGLLAVGAALQPGAGRGHVALIGLASLGKLVLMPLTAALIGTLVGLPPLARDVAVLTAAMPTASSSYILARLMGGDAPLMATILTVQTLAAAVTLPLVLTLLA